MAIRRGEASIKSAHARKHQKRWREGEINVFSRSNGVTIFYFCFHLPNIKAVLSWRSLRVVVYLSYRKRVRAAFTEGVSRMNCVDVVFRKLCCCGYGVGGAAHERMSV